MTKRSVVWREWGQAAFEESLVRRRPLFILVTDAWTQTSAGAPAAVAEDPVVAGLLESSFVPVLADADVHPEVVSRYASGETPCAFVLHADGNVALGFPRLDLREIQAGLRAISSCALDRASPGARGLGRFRVPYLPADESNLERGTEMIEAIRRHLERRLGPGPEGFGEGLEIAGIAALRFLMEYARQTGDEELSQKVLESFHAQAHSDLYDPTEGGFFSRRRGGLPQTDKRLSVNAEWLKFSLLVSARREGRFALPLAQGILHYLQNRLLLPNRAFAAGQREDAAYYRLSYEERRHVSPPPLNTSVFAAANSAAISAFSAAWQVFGEKAYLEIALGAEAFLQTNHLAPDGTVAHVVESAPRGIGYLQDQVAVGNARLCLYRSTLDPVHLRGIRDAARNLIDSFANPAGAGFLDLRIAAESSRMPCAPILDPLSNARAAEFLARASAQLEEPAYAAPARKILSALMEQEVLDVDALSLVGSALIATLYPMPYFVAVTDGSESQRTRVVERIRGFGGPFPMIFHNHPAQGERMHTLPRLTAHCAHQHDEVLVP